MDEGIILITGASSDIGRSLVRLIKKKSAHRILATRFTPGKPLFGSKVEEVVLDASSLVSIEAVSKQIGDLPISHFVQLQGDALLDDSIENQTLERLEYHLRVNSLSSILLLKSILPGMVSRRFGHIVLMNTASSEHGGGKNAFGYGLAKHSTGYIAKHVAKYYGEYNIIANCISPGFINTKFHTERMQRSREQMKERIKMVRLGRAGTAGELAEFIEFLMFRNRFISGQNIKYDGADFI